MLSQVRIALAFPQSSCSWFLSIVPLCQEFSILDSERISIVLFSILRKERKAFILFSNLTEGSDLLSIRSKI